MKTGIELIAAERQEQIEKHNRTIEYDVEMNNCQQLKNGAIALFSSPSLIPGGWDETLWEKMNGKAYKERLITAGALLAAEIDRISYDE